VSEKLVFTLTVVPVPSKGRFHMCVRCTTETPA